MNYLKAFVLFLKTRLRKFYNPAVYATLNSEMASRRNFYASFVKKNDIAFDIGANLGNRIQPLLSIGAKVIAVEPQSLCYNYIKLIYGKKITALKMAMGAKRYSSVIHINNQSSTISSMSDEWIRSVKNSRFKNLDWNKTEKVEVETLDNLISKYGKPQFIKIDVEGFEAEVLKGLSMSIPVISFEYTTPEQTVQLTECLNLLDKIDKDYVYNYSIGESNEFKNSVWLSNTELVNIITQNVDILQGFGDIYARQPAVGFK